MNFTTESNKPYTHILQYPFSRPQWMRIWRREYLEEGLLEHLSLQSFFLGGTHSQLLLSAVSHWFVLFSAVSRFCGAFLCRQGLTNNRG